MLKLKIITYLVILCFILAGITPVASCLSENNFEEELTSGVNTDSYDYNEVRVHASFSWSPKYPDPDETINFISTSTSTHGYISYYKWTFHDGSTAYGSETTRTYEEKGSYKVKLEVRAHGYYSSHDLDYTIKYVKVGASPFSIFTIKPDDPSPRENVTLNASKSYDVNGEIINYNWSIYNVKDPVNITYLDPKIINYYTWAEQGVYNISLFVEDDDGFNNTCIKTIPVSILKIGDISTIFKNINFTISNHGNLSAENVNWGVDIIKYHLFDFPRYIFHKNDTVNFIDANSSENFTIDDFRRIFCKVKIVVTAEADNAVKVSKSIYALVLGKNIYLTEEDFNNPYTVILVSSFLISVLALYSILILKFIKIYFQARSA